jgi:hypothetical protein
MKNVFYTFSSIRKDIKVTFLVSFGLNGPNLRLDSLIHVRSADWNTPVIMKTLFLSFSKFITIFSKKKIQDILINTGLYIKSLSSN